MIRVLIKSRYSPPTVKHFLLLTNLQVCDSFVPAGGSSAPDSLPPVWRSAADTPTSWKTQKQGGLFKLHPLFTWCLLLQVNEHTHRSGIIQTVCTHMASLLWISLSFSWIWFFSSITFWASCRTKKNKQLFNNMFSGPEIVFTTSGK